VDAIFCVEPVTAWSPPSARPSDVTAAVDRAHARTGAGPDVDAADLCGDDRGDADVDVVQDGDVADRDVDETVLPGLGAGRRGCDGADGEAARGEHGGEAGGATSEKHGGRPFGRCLRPTVRLPRRAIRQTCLTKKP
jgi:hypothetical protein